LETIIDLDILVWILLSDVDFESWPIFKNGITEANMVACCGVTIGNNVDVEPWRKPFILIFKIIGIALRLSKHRH